MITLEEKIDFLRENSNAKSRMEMIDFERKGGRKISPMNIIFVENEYKSLRHLVEIQKKKSSSTLQKVQKSVAKIVVFERESVAGKLLDEIELKFMRQINLQINTNNENSMKLGNPSNNNLTNQLIMKELKQGWSDVNDLKNRLFYYKNTGNLKLQETKLRRSFVISECFDLDELTKQNKNLNVYLLRARKSLKKEQLPSKIREIQGRIIKLQNDKRKIKERKLDLKKSLKTII